MNIIELFKIFKKLFQLNENEKLEEALNFYVGENAPEISKQNFLTNGEI